MNTRRALLFAAALASLLTSGGLARTADPTKEECVKASESGQGLLLRRRLEEARAQFLLCVTARCPAVLRDDCTQRLEEIRRVQPSIVFEAKDGAGHDLSDVKVTVDGRPLADRLDGTGLAVDPGEHTFVFEVAGRPQVTRKLVLYEGEKSRREVVAFAGNPPEGTSQRVPLATGATEVRAESAAAPRSSWSTQKTMALLLAGGSAAGIAVGTIFGLEAIDRNNQSNADGHCDATGCDPTGKQLRKDALSAATVSTIAFGAGAAAFVGGVVLWVTAPSTSGSSSTSVALAPLPGFDGAGLRVRLEWR
jgi:hypothetical protein